MPITQAYELVESTNYPYSTPLLHRDLLHQLGDPNLRWIHLWGRRKHLRCRARQDDQRHSEECSGGWPLF